MNSESYIGIDLGGTQVRAALVQNEKLIRLESTKIDASASMEKVLEEVFELTTPLMNKTIKGIGIGVPGLIDTENGMVYDVVNIPSWKILPLQKLVQEKYQLPVFVNNDANCFALGEFYFGQGRGKDALIGLTIGTGLGSGIIIDGKLFSGSNGGAGEFGMMDYLDHCYEYYASGQFFENCYGIKGEEVYQLAKQGQPEALNMYLQMGAHLGNAIRNMVYAVDINLIILGGSVSKAFLFFSESMWQNIRKLAFTKPLQNLQILVSDLENSGVLGAAALCYDVQKI
ncbi:MAG: ROK family protein [Flavisolibacter sp.]